MNEIDNLRSENKQLKAQLKNCLAKLAWKDEWEYPQLRKSLEKEYEIIVTINGKEYVPIDSFDKPELP